MAATREPATAMDNPSRNLSLSLEGRMIDSKVGRRGSGARRQIAVWVAMGASAIGVGCGSVTSMGNPDAGKDLAALVGSWTLGSGTITLTCSGLVTTSAVSGNEMWQLGTSSDLMQPAGSSSSGCVLLANVSGKTATALPNQSCSKMGVALTLTAYTFVVGSSGTATETASGTETVNMGGAGTTCSYAETATFTKSS
jgi:hypothetical protein